MERTERLWSVALGCANDFLRRFADAFTRSERDDLVQETAWTAWRWADRLRDEGRFAAAVRTIARRKRWTALHEERRRREQGAWLVGRRHDEPGQTFLVVGRKVPLDWLMHRLHTVLARLREIDRQLLLCIHEGFCCAELASRFRLSEQSVKARVHRARRRVQMEIEDAVREAGDFDGF